MNDQPGRGRPKFPEGEAATHHIHIRTTRERKGHYVRFARNKKPSQSLSDMIVEVCDRETGYVEKQTGEIE